MTIRQTIIRELKRQKKTRYWLAKKTKMHYPTIHNYCSGKFDLNTAKIERIMKELGLEIRPKE
jgi:IS30 family transposase